MALTVEDSPPAPAGDGVIEDSPPAPADDGVIEDSPPAPADDGVIEDSPPAPADDGVIEDSPPAPADDGVIEDSRTNRRRRCGRAAFAAVLLLGAGLVAGAVAAATGGSAASSSRPPTASSPPPTITIRQSSTYVDGARLEVGITPDFAAGTVALDVAVAGFQPPSDGAPGYAIIERTGYPTASDPLFGPNTSYFVANRSGVYVAPVGAEVVRMRVNHLGTFTPRRIGGLLPGQRAIVFRLPPGKRGRVFAPGFDPHDAYNVPPPSRALTEQVYDASGHPIPISEAERDGAGYTVPGVTSASWRAPARPAANARCAMSSSLAGASALVGRVATTIAPDRAVTGTAFLSCMDTLYIWHGMRFTTAILLNARSPGKLPAPLWNARPVPGQPGTVAIPAVRYRITDPPRRIGRVLAKALARLRDTTHRAPRLPRAHGRRVMWITLVPAAAARRVGDAWLVVRDGDWPLERVFTNSDSGEPSHDSDGDNPAADLRFLAGLHVTRQP